MRWTSAWIVAQLATLAAGPSPAAAHPGVATSALVKVDSAGRVLVVVSHDALAFALNDLSRRVSDAAMYELLDGGDAALTRSLADARGRFTAQFHLRADARPIAIEVTDFPALADARHWEKAHPDRRLPLKLDIVARAVLPADARSVVVQFPEVLDSVIVTFDRPGAEPIALPLSAGESSPAIAVTLAAAPATRPTQLTGATRAQADDEPAASQPPAVAATPNTLDVARRYVILGFEHILPEGMDHALFVLGLFLLNPRFKTLVWQITAFTIAHTATLTLTTFHLVSMPSGIIEPTIAASIAFVAVENLFTTRVHAWRPVVAFVFGLVHGMGFASALSEVGLPTGQLVAGVLSFNVGVECGHVLVLAIAFALLGAWRNKPWYRRRVSMPLSLVIASVALFWMVQRLGGVA